MGEIGGYRVWVLIFRVWYLSEDNWCSFGVIRDNIKVDQVQYLSGGGVSWGEAYLDI